MIPKGQTALPCALAKQEGRESRPARLTERRMIIISPGSELENWSPGICRNGTDNRPIPQRGPEQPEGGRELRRSFRPRPFLFENGCWMTLEHALTRQTYWSRTSHILCRANTAMNTQNFSANTQHICVEYVSYMLSMYCFCTVHVS